MVGLMSNVAGFNSIWFWRVYYLEWAGVVSFVLDGESWLWSFWSDELSKSAR